MPSNKKLLQAAAGNAGGDKLYVENVFSTYLYAGTNSSQVITNGLDLAGEGGLIWFKNRSSNDNNCLYDTERGAGKVIFCNTTGAQLTNTGSKVDFNSDGFDTGTSYGGSENGSGKSIVSWSFRKAEKFFDVVTYTGSGSNRTISHNLGSVPGFIIVKRTSSVEDWTCYHISLGATKCITLNGTGTSFSLNGAWNDTAPTDSVFSLGTHGRTNTNGQTYVAYLFASDAGGFGDDGDESIIKCGSYTGNGSIDGPTVPLGFEPQWIMIKGAGVSSNWTMFDNMRGLAVGENDARLFADGNFTESDTQKFINLQATGFKLQGQTNNASNGSGQSYIYIAIRRPMKTPEYGTEVLSTVAYTGTGADKFLTSSSVVDLAFNKSRTSGDWNWTGRMRGAGRTLYSNGDFGEGSDPNGIKGFDYNNGVLLGSSGTVNSNGGSFISYMLSRSTGAFDVAVPTATQSAVQPATGHNLGVVPEFIISKSRDSNAGWYVYHSALGLTKYLSLNSTNAFQVYNAFGTTLTSTQFQYYSPASGESIVNYLFATVAGVSKVGGYTGTGNNLNVDCGFSAGARFVMIKRTDAAGDWFIWDSVRGIVSGDDPYVRWNLSSAEVTNTDYIDPLSSGFTVTSSASSTVNVSSGSYIFLAIA